MTEGGFFDRKTASPTGLTIVIAMHAAALGALALVKGPEIFRRPPVIDLIDIRTPPPEEDPPPKQRRENRPQEPSVIDRPDPIVQRPVEEPVFAERDPPDMPSVPWVGPDPVPPQRVDPPAPPPPAVRTAAEIDPRFAGALQPPYPTSELRAEREGTVRVRVTIGADGRVKAIERLSATSEAFWAATERHARAHWRFRPATVDGRPVESAKIMNVQFELRA